MILRERKQMQMKTFTRQVIMGVGLWLGLGMIGECAHADNWYREHGLASYYGKGFHGRKAVDGDRFSQNEMTAAHRNLPLQTASKSSLHQCGNKLTVFPHLIPPDSNRIGIEK